MRVLASVHCHRSQLTKRAACTGLQRQSSDTGIAHQHRSYYRMRAWISGIFASTYDLSIVRSLSILHIHVASCGVAELVQITQVYQERGYELRLSGDAEDSVLTEGACCARRCPCTSDWIHFVQFAVEFDATID